MRVGLFVPCYIDQFYPRVAIATLELLEKAGCRVDYPLDQTCCGQPLANAGHASKSLAAMGHFINLFDDCDYVVAPSGSCVHFVRHHFDLLEQTDAVQRIRRSTYELCGFMTDILKVDAIDARFPHRVGLHASCHGLRGLRLGASSELRTKPFDKVRSLLALVQDLDLIDLDRADECCGFGGTFAVTEEAISVRMGRDRLEDHVLNGAEYVTGTDMSCLMHLEGLIRRDNGTLQVKHVAEILNGDRP